MSNQRIIQSGRPAERGATKGARLLLVLLAMLPATGCQALRRAPARLPDVSELSRASARIAAGMEAVHLHTRQSLERAFAAPMPCPAAADPDAPAPPADCFSHIFRPRIEAAKALAAYAGALAEIVGTAGRARKDVAALAAAAGDFLKSLGLPSLPPAVQRAAATALDLWDGQRDAAAAANLAAAVAQVDPHVMAVLDALIADLDDARGLLIAARKRLVLQLLMSHNDELALRRVLEARRQALSASLAAAPGAAPQPGTTGDPDGAADPGHAGKLSAATVTELAKLQQALSRLPRREDLAPRDIDRALVVLDACRAALVEWQRAHHRLQSALAEGRQPDLELVAAASAVIHDATRALMAPR